MKLLQSSGIVFALLGLAFMSSAQQEPQFLQNLDNMLYYNPAYAGSRGMLNLSALHRQQWLGFKGAPMTTTFQMHTPLRYESVGVGFSFINDKAGPINTNWINADFSYSLQFKNKAKLAFGLKGGVQLLNGDLTGLYTNQANDPTLQYRYNNVAKFNFGGGVYYHSKQWFAGIAVPKLLEHFKSASLLMKEQRHYYLMVGGYVKLNRQLKLRPAAMIKITENAPIAIDGSLAVIFYDRFWLGGNYRIKESAGMFAQFQLNNQFKIGYGFEVTTSRIVKHNYGTHELLISYDFIYKHRDLASPRYF